MASSVLVEQHLGMVRKLAGRLARKLPPSIEVDDLIQAGSIGLLEASERWDESSPAEFSTYAYRRVLGAMLDSVRRGAWREATAEPLDDRTPAEIDVERDAARRELRSHVQYEVGRLSERKRRLLLMLVYENIPLRRAAKTMRMGELSALCLHTSALATLRKTLGHLRPTH